MKRLDKIAADLDMPRSVMRLIAGCFVVAATLALGALILAFCALGLITVGIYLDITGAL